MLLTARRSLAIHSGRKVQRFVPLATMTTFSKVSKDKVKVNIPPLKGFLDRVDENNTNLDELPTLTPFIVAGKTVGQLKSSYVDALEIFGTHASPAHVPHVLQQICGPPVSVSGCVSCSWPNRATGQRESCPKY